MNRFARLAPDASAPETHTSRKVGKQTVVQGDCLAQLRSMAVESVDVVVTSPPYNIGISYGTYDDRLPREAYLAWLAEIGGELHRVMSTQSSFFLNVGNTNADPWITTDVANAFRPIFTLQNTIVWVKSVAIGENTVGHFKPINSRRFLNNNHETIFHFTKGGRTQIDRLAVGVPFKDKSNIARWGHTRDRRCAGNIWFIPYRTVRSRAQKFDHPAGFPVELPRRCIQLHGKPCAVVLDPFLGAGTTLVAAQELGCTGIGIELDGDYVAASLARLEAAVT
jgi:site-specific DNA-methyltransferase (adenine-specific)